MNGIVRKYKSGGSIFLQRGYRRGRQFVKAHFKTRPDGKSKNRKSILGF